MSDKDKEKNYNSGEFPRIEEIESALGQLNEHNSKHTGLGGALKRVLESVFDNDNEDVNKDSNSDELHDYSLNLESHNADDEAEFSEEITKYNISPVLKMIGLDLYNHERLVESNSSDGGGLPYKQGLYVSDIKPFVDFMNNNLNLIPESKSVSKMIKDLYDSILRDIETTKGDYREGLIKDLADIHQVVKSINYNNNRPRLELGESYINWGKKPEFEDYLLSRKLGLTGGEGFDAHKWHTDSPSSNLEIKWNSLLEHFTKVSRTYGDNNELTMLMKMELREALGNLNKWVENPPENYKKNEEYMESIRKSLQIVNANAKKSHL